MELPSDAMEQVKGLEDNLLHATQMALAEVGVISPLRINREVVRVLLLLWYNVTFVHRFSMHVHARGCFVHPFPYSLTFVYPSSSRCEFCSLLSLSF